MVRQPSKAWRRSLSGYQVDGYKLLEFIGEGNIGQVYRAEQTEFPGSSWAIKLIFGELKSGWKVELNKVMQLGLVPYVVHFHGLGAAHITHRGETHLCQYTVWDYIPPGENLKDHLNRVGEVSISFLVSVVERILHVLNSCQEKDVVRHGDLHAGNILIGDASATVLDDSLQRRAPVYVSDFGYGATGAAVAPKDDYQGLANIINTILEHIDYSRTTATDRQILLRIRQDLGKLLRDRGSERRGPQDLLEALLEMKREAKGHDLALTSSGPPGQTPNEEGSVGQFQVSEMIGERWNWWERLFVPTVPARSKILTLDIPTVVTGPRGCGKTMLFRRLSERLVVECGQVTALPMQEQFMALYVNANDFADAFTHFPREPTRDDEARLVCYANLCVLADLLAVQSARVGRLQEQVPDALLSMVEGWVVSSSDEVELIDGEDRLERYRTVVEQVKWTFLTDSFSPFPALSEMSQFGWLGRFVQAVRSCSPWFAGRSVLLFVDDFSTPRVSQSMQRVLNRLFLQRSPHFLSKIATEAFCTFVSEDSSGKKLQDGDDYQLVDMGEEALFLPDEERLSFLRQVFSRRLTPDTRVPAQGATLEAVLGRTPFSKTEFARRLRTTTTSGDPEGAVDGSSQRRGRSRARVTYTGASVFADLWSGDTRTMIQLMTDIVDDAPRTGDEATSPIALPVPEDVQDRILRNRGGQWLDSQTRNEPTNPDRVEHTLAALREEAADFELAGAYGEHLKAVVEAFVAAARELLLGPTYQISEGSAVREVPRMAFRMEIVDDFRISGLAQEVYVDLVRYGLFMRDSRGKSVRGAFVPRLYLRRLLLPFCSLALSKRDSVQLKCEDFIKLLLEPDRFKDTIFSRRSDSTTPESQMVMPFLQPSEHDAAYDDLQEGADAEGP